MTIYDARGQVAARRRVIFRVSLAILAVAVAVAGTTRADEVAGIATDLISSDAIAYVEIARPADLIDRVASPDVRELARAVPDLEEQLQGKQIRDIRNVANVVASALGSRPLAVVRRLTSGGMAAAVEGRTSPERIVLIVRPDDVAFLEKAHNTLLSLARADAEGKGNPDPVTETEYRDLTLYTVSPQEAHAIVGDRLVVANGLETLKTVIDRAGGHVEFARLSEDQKFVEARRATSGDALAFAFARMDRLREIDPKRFGQKPDAGAIFLFGPWIESLRLSEWAAASVDWTGERLAAEIVLPVPPEGYPDHLARYRPGPGQGAMPALEPPGTLLSVSLWRDLSAIWEVKQEIFPPEQLQNLAQLDTTAGTFFGGRDFGTGVLGSIGREWRLVIAHQDYDSLEPAPDLKLPGFALVVGLKPGDEEFAVRLRSAFQSFIGLANLGAAQQKAPPLMLGSEEHHGVSVSTARYLAPKKSGEPESDTPVDTRFNFSPSYAQVGDTVLLGSSLGLVESLIETLQEANGAADAETQPTLLMVADGSQAARLVDLNRDRLAMNNMLEKGNTRERAAAQVDLLARLLRYLGRGRLTVTDRPETTRLSVEFRLSGE